MSTDVAAARVTIAPEEKEQTDKRLDLFARFLQAGIANTTLLPDVPEDALLFLLPDDDSEFTEQEIAAAAHSARRGMDVYLHHVYASNLPDLADLPGPLEPQPGYRQATFDPETGAVLTNQIFGADGLWHDTDLPLPGPRDDEDPWFCFG